MKIVVTLLSPLLFLLLLNSCREVKETETKAVELGLNAFIVKEHPYVQDESLDVFLKNPWYTYDENNHIIWPNFQVYVLKSKGSYYRIQVADYYDDSSNPGNYTLRVGPAKGESFDWDFQAQGCGNVYTNLSFKECLKDPNRNVYTYLEIEKKRSWQMSEAQAQKSERWDIAFNGTEVKINSGKNGPGDTRIGDLYLYQPFFLLGVADFQRIAEVSFADQGLRFFELDLDLQSVALSVPQGIDRAVFEEDWLYKSPEKLFKARAENWWMLWGGEEKSFFKFRVKEISDVIVGDIIESKITLEFFKQAASDARFDDSLISWTLPQFDSVERLLKWCLDFDSRSVVDCSTSIWDLRLSISNRRGNRRWRFNVKRGAIGPLSEDDMLWRRSGLPPFL